MADDSNKRSHCPRHWTLAQRLDHYTDKSGGPDACWPWMGARNKKGYGFLNWMGKMRLVSRLVWEQANGPIPAGMKVCHKCDNPPCRNESHLFLGTNADNLADMASKGRAARGEAHSQSRLTEEQVIAIRAASGTLSAIAARFGVGKTTVAEILRRETWRHLL